MERSLSVFLFFFFFGGGDGGSQNRNRQVRRKCTDFGERGGVFVAVKLFRGYQSPRIPRACPVGVVYGVLRRLCSEGQTKRVESAKEKKNRRERCSVFLFADNLSRLLGLAFGDTVTEVKHSFLFRFGVCASGIRNSLLRTR